MNDEYNDTCPNCGEYPTEPEGFDNPGTWLYSSPHTPTFTDYGPGEDWTETHKCQSCGTVYSFRNGYP